MDDHRLVDFIERSIDRDPFCTSCGAPTDVRDRNGALVLECSAIGAAPERSGPLGRLGRLGRLVTALVPHDRVVLLAPEERAA